jgi:hypothetical protein
MKHSIQYSTEMFCFCIAQAVHRWLKMGRVDIHGSFPEFMHPMAFKLCNGKPLKFEGSCLKISRTWPLMAFLGWYLKTFFGVGSSKPCFFAQP